MEIENGLKLFSKHMFSKTKILSELFKNLFCKPLNPPELIEISGESGSGKTILLLDLMSTVLMPENILKVDLNGLNLGILFIDTDQHFSIIHFTDMIERKIKKKLYYFRSKWKKIAEKKDEELVKITKKDFNKKIEDALKICLNNLIYINCSESNKYATTLLSLEHYLEKKNVALVVIDSVSSFYWLDRNYKCDNWHKMEQYQNSIHKKLIETIKKNCLVCICTKQLLFKTQIEKDLDLQSEIDDPVFNDFKLEKNLEFDYLGREWTKNVTIKINMTQLEDNKTEMGFENVPDNMQVFKIVSSDMDLSKSLHCTVAEDGINWL